MNPKPHGHAYGSVHVEGVALYLTSREIGGCLYVNVEMQSSWGAGHIPAYALILAADAARSIVGEIEPERLRPPVRWVPTSMVGGGML